MFVKCHRFINTCNYGRQVLSFYSDSNGPFRTWRCIMPIQDKNCSKWVSKMRVLDNFFQASQRKILESEEVEFPCSLSKSSPVAVPKLVVATFTISITVMRLSTKDRLMSNVSSSFPSMQSQWNRCQQTVLGILNFLNKLTFHFPFWAWVTQFPSSKQNTKATIYQQIRLKLLSFFYALCSKI